MAKLIRIDGKLARLGGKLVTDAGGAPCCCGGAGGCPECADPTFPRSESNCDPLDVPTDYYLGQEWANDTSDKLSPWMSMSRKGSLVFSYNWKYRNGDRVLPWWGSGRVTWDTQLGPQQLTQGQGHCELTGLDQTGIASQFPWSRETYDGDVQEGEGLLVVAAGSFGSANGRFSPILYHDWNGIQLRSYSIPARFRIYGGPEAEWRAWGGLAHGAQFDLQNEQRLSIGNISEFTVQPDDIQQYDASIDTGGRYFGNTPCSVNTCYKAEIHHDDPLIGQMDVSFQEQVTSSVSCMFPTDGSTGEHVLAGGICPGRPPPDIGDPPPLGPPPGGEAPGGNPPLDPAIQAVLDQQARGGGCVGCGQG